MSFNRCFRQRTIPSPPSAGPQIGEPLLFDDYSQGDRVNVLGNPMWNYPGAVANITIGRIDVVASPLGSPAATMLQGTCLGRTDPYDVYIEMVPQVYTQGDRYAYDRTLGGTYVEGRYRALECWVLPDERYIDTFNTGANHGSGAGIQLGTYSEDPRLKGNFPFTQESGGNHGYHSLVIGRTHGRWMKLKWMRVGGMRSNWTLPVSYGTVASTNGVPFIVGESMLCDSGPTLKFTAETAAWTKFPFTPRTIWGMWTTPNGNMAYGDTVTGLTSGAVRVLKADIVNGLAPANQLTQFYELSHVEDACGEWSGYSEVLLQGGFTDNWVNDYPNKTYWDRITRFYIFAQFSPNVDVPIVTSVTGWQWTSDARDDIIAVSNLGAVCDPTTDQLFVTWQKNSNMVGKTWEIYVGYTDFHTAGLGSGTLWNTVTDSDPALTVMSQSGILAGTANRPLYIAIKPSDRATFAQIQIGTDTQTLY